MISKIRAKSLALTPLIAVCLQLPVSAQGETPQLDLFCTSNRDGTGACFDESKSQSVPYDCVVVPGSVVPCKSPEGLLYQCQWVGMQQAQLACELKSTEEQPLSQPGDALAPPPELNFPQSQPLVDAQDDFSTFPATSNSEAEDAVDSSEFANTFVPDGASSAVPSGAADVGSESGVEASDDPGEIENAKDPFLQNLLDLQ